MSKEKKGYGKAICTIVGLLCIFLFKFLPAPSGLNELDMQIAGIFIGTIWLWLTVSTSWPSMLVIAVLAMSPLFTSSQALAGSMGSWVTSFVLLLLHLCTAENRFPEALRGMVCDEAHHQEKPLDVSGDVFPGRNGGRRVYVSSANLYRVCRHRRADL